MRASLSGKDVPEDIKSRLLALHEENVALKESYKTAQEKLLKARTVCRILWILAEMCAHSISVYSLLKTRINCSRKNKLPRLALHQSVAPDICNSPRPTNIVYE